MKAITHLIRNDNTSNNVKKIEVFIGKDVYTITESIDNKLTINKVGDIIDTMFITPRYTNEIEIS